MSDGAKRAASRSPTQNERDRGLHLDQRVALAVALRDRLRLRHLGAGGHEQLVPAVLARVRVEEQLVVVVLVELARRQLPPHLLPGADHAALAQPELAPHLQHERVDDAHAAHAAHRAVEQLVVLDERAVVADPPAEGLGVGDPFLGLHTHQLAAGHDQVEGANGVRERAERDPRAVRGGGHHARDRLRVVAAHVREAEALRIEQRGSAPAPACLPGHGRAGGPRAAAPGACRRPRRVMPFSRSVSTRMPSVSATSDHAWPAPTARMLVPCCSARRTSCTTSSVEDGCSIWLGWHSWSRE